MVSQRSMKREQQTSASVRRMARERMRSRRLRPALSGFMRVALASVTAMLLLSTFVSSAGAAASAFIAMRFLETIPSPEGLGKTDLFQSTKIYDRNGILLYELFDGSSQGGRRTSIKLSDLTIKAPHVISATLATEDASFYSNPGFDIVGIARAAYQQYTEGEIVSGGSTITQQVARRILLDENERFDQTYTRKLKEIILAYQMYRTYWKDDILQMYLNEIFYGNVSYGIEAAAQSYFGKPATELSLAEAAMLAGIPASPYLYDPLTHPREAKARQEQVLDLMVKHGFLKASDAYEAKQANLEYKQYKAEIKAPHFVFYVRDLLEERFGGPRLYRGGYSVYTTLDYRIQQEAERAVAEGIDEVRRYKATNAALVAMDPKTGQVLAMVGSANYWDDSIDGRVNVALAERQPGSSIKPITYVAAFAQGWTPGMMILDEPLSIKDGDKYWRPMNYDNGFHGWMTVRQALGNSWNIPAVKAIQFVGVETMIEYARKMGESTFRDPSRYGLSITLGGGEVKLLEHVGAYSVFANGGNRVKPNPFLKITDESGEVVYDFQADKERVLSEELAYMITDVLSDNQARSTTYGLNSDLKLSRPAAAKTGTTDDHRDGWTMGYTPNLAVGVWVGNSDNTPMAGLYGSRSSSPIWNDFMETALAMKTNKEGEEPKPLFPVENFVRPPGIIDVNTCRTVTNPETGDSTNTCRKDIGIRAAEPSKDRFTSREVVVNKKDGKIALSSCRPEDVEKRTYLIPVQGAILSEEEKKLPQPPTQYSDCARPALTANAVSSATAAANQTPTPGAIPTSTPGPSGNTSVSISSPRSGEALAGNIAVGGTASGANFASYKVEVSPGLNGAQFTTLSEGTRPVEGGYLATFPTTRYRNGTYTIVVSVFDKSGKTTTSSTRVVVAN